MTDCILWTGYVTPDGYGRTVVPGGKGKRAHRLAYERAYGPIPEGMTVDHLCFNTTCVNPEHLRLLTPVENARNQRSTHSNVCRNGLHEYTPENTIMRDRGRGPQRECRACGRARTQRYEARRRAA